MLRTTRSFWFLQLAVLYPVFMVPHHAPRPPLVEKDGEAKRDRSDRDRPAHPKDSPPDRDRLSS